MTRDGLLRLLTLAERATGLAADDRAWLTALRAGLEHRHEPFVMRVSPGGYRWVCATCPAIGGPPRETAAEAWRLSPGGEYDRSLRAVA